VIRLWTHRSRELDKKVSSFIESSKQGSSCTKASGSPEAKFSKKLLILWGNSTQWRPLLPKDGGLIQVDIDGHPPFPAGSKHLSSNFDNLLFLAVFRVLNFWSRFEALSDVFWGMLRLKIFTMKFSATVVFLR
jgi:hypothetical protein